ncbi:hypothetical protein MG293_014920 [Ovis ammon polii]|uniref:Uncharacterized protein n=1 Tax=Ovis ammon polii TaxID=230172 RepID=A0AAD4TXK1_OVIAM|nr:hypothetical protein MG293_014920 [Ovis ammon polii]
MEAGWSSKLLSYSGHQEFKFKCLKSRHSQNPGRRGLRFYISIKRIEVTLPLAALRTSNGTGPGYQRRSIDVKLWMAIKGQIVERMTDGGASWSPTPRKFSLMPDQQILKIYIKSEKSSVIESKEDTDSKLFMQPPEESSEVVKSTASHGAKVLCSHDQLIYVEMPSAKFARGNMI